MNQPHAPLVLCQISDGVATLTLTHAHKLNALGLPAKAAAGSETAKAGQP